jgi:DNA-binding FadR family transcriptional regulator
MNSLKPPVLPRRRSVSLAQEVMGDLMGRIRSGQYKPGEKLPTEPEVMAEQGVSRTVVREAISRLQAAGLVETRHGVGTFVLPATSQPPHPLDFSTVVTIRDVLAMLELRISLETEAAGLAAVRRTDEQLQRMRDAVQAFEEGVGRGETSVEADYQFHLQIALATHNKYFDDSAHPARHLAVLGGTRAELLVPHQPRAREHPRCDRPPGSASRQRGDAHAPDQQPRAPEARQRGVRPGVTAATQGERDEISRLTTKASKRDKPSRSG